MNYRITYIVLAFDFYLELKFAKKKKSPCIKQYIKQQALIFDSIRHNFSFVNFIKPAIFRLNQSDYLLNELKNQKYQKYQNRTKRLCYRAEMNS